MSPVRRWVVWCLIFALPICGESSTIAAMLGARHFHAMKSAHALASPSHAVLVDFRRGDQVAQALSASHDHSWLRRHHHAAADDSVMALDAVTGDVNANNGAAGIDGAVVLVLAWFGRIAPWPAHTRAGAWPVADASPFNSCDSRRAERPPRT